MTVDVERSERGPLVVGLDLSIAATGACAWDGATWTIKLPASAGDWRLSSLAYQSLELAESADLTVIEGPVTRSSAATIIGMVHGAVRTELLRAGRPFALITPATLKKYATGKGNADKTAMAMAAYKRGGVEFADDNQCDAWWLRAAGLQHLGHPIVDLPAAQVAALEKVQWPAVPSQVDGDRA